MGGRSAHVVTGMEHEAVWRRKLARAGADLTRARRDRDDLVVAAAAKGMTYRAIGEAVGLSHVAVRDLVRRYDELEHP
jgi:hypothetical protein